VTYVSNTLVPPLDWDVLAYHLAIPKIFIQGNAISYIPFIPYANWPLGTEMLFTLGLIIDSDPLAHVMTWLSFVILITAIFMFGKKFFNSEVGILSAVVFSASPMIMRLVGVAMVEIPLTLFTFLAASTLICWFIDGSKPYWILSALFAGMAASTKFNAVLIPAILGTLMIIVTVLRKQEKFIPIVGRYTGYGLIALAVVLPWYTKAWIQTGNPLWPFFHSVLGGRNWDDLGSEYLFGYIRGINMPLTFKNWLTGLWKLTLESNRFGSYRLGWIYLTLLPFSIPAMFFIPNLKQRRVLRWLGLVTVILYTSWFYQTHQTRFLIIATSFMALLASAGVYWFTQLRKGWWQTVTQLATICYLVSFHWLLTMETQERITEVIPYLIGRTGRDAYYESHLPGYSVFKYANTQLDKDDYILFDLWENRGYLLENRYAWSNPINQRDLKLETFENPDQLVVEFQQRGFTHLISSSIFGDSFLNIKYGQHYAELMGELIEIYGIKKFQSGPITLYELPSKYELP
jgi:4-amino-4-deoxy-L-arabinose transferase-like glycosyltransferase